MPVFGVNLPWLDGSYGHDLAINERYPEWGYAFDAATFDRPLREARALGMSAVRIWLCELGEGIVTRDSAVDGVHPALLEHVARLSEVAREERLTVYWTLLDANAVARDGDALTRSILVDPNQTARFAERVAKPLARAFDADTTFAIEIVNEPEVITPSCDGDVAWATLGAALRTIGDAVREERDAPVTAGTMHVFLDALFGADPRLDAIDVHVYHHDGGLPSAAQLAELLDDPRIGGAIPVFGGECGLPQDDPPPAARLAHYLYNAGPNDYAAVFLWRLENWLVEQTEARAITDGGKAVRMAIEKLEGR